MEHTYGRHTGQTSKHMHRPCVFMPLCSTCAPPTSLITATGVFDSSDTERSVTVAHLFISTSSLRIKIFPLSDLLSPNSTCTSVLNPQPRLCFLSPQLPSCFFWLQPVGWKGVGVHLNNREGVKKIKQTERGLYIICNLFLKRENILDSLVEPKGGQY